MDRFTQILVTVTVTVAVASAAVLGSIAVASNYPGNLKFDVKSDGVGLSINNDEVSSEGVDEQ